MSLDESDPELETELVVLLEELAEHRDTLGTLVETAETLEQSGLLDLLLVVGTRDVESGEQLYETFAENPEDLRAVQNVSLLAGGLSRVDPDTLAAAMESVEAGQPVSRDAWADPPEIGLVGILRQLRDPDIQRGLGVVFLFLKAIGSRPTP